MRFSVFNVLALSTILFGVTACKPSGNSQPEHPNTPQSAHPLPAVGDTAGGHSQTANHSTPSTHGGSSSTGATTPGGTTTRADSAASAALDARYAAQLPPAVNALDICRQRYFTQLPTFGAGLEDVSVNVRDMQPWASTNLQDYVGTYNAGLDATVSEITFQVKNGRLIGTLGYQTEVPDAEGMLVPSRGSETMVYSLLEGAILRWPRLRVLKPQIGQFVTWTSGGRTMRGVLLYEDSQTPFTLLLKK